MKKLATGVIALASLLLTTGCSVDNENKSPMSTPSSSAVSSDSTSPSGESSAEAAEPTVESVAENGDTVRHSEYGKNDPAAVEAALSVIESASENLDKALADDNRSYASNYQYMAQDKNGAVEAVTFLLQDQSSENSYCVAGTSVRDPTLTILYDSQQDRILEQGESCKKPKGEPFTDVYGMSAEELEVNMNRAGDKL